MQDRPTPQELLAAIADLLEGAALEATTGPLKHQIRVAGNLCRILERESGLGDAAETREIRLLAEVLGVDPGVRNAASLSAELADRLERDDEELERRAWPALLEIVRGKLAIAKPGHDDFDYSSEQSG